MPQRNTNFPPDLEIPPSRSELSIETDLGGFVGFGRVHAHFKTGRIDGLLTAARSNGQQGHEDKSQSHGVAEG